MAASIKENIINSLTWFWGKLRTTYVTNLASTNDDLALAASQGKVLNDAVNARLPLTGGTMIGPIAMAGQDLQLKTVSGDSDDSGDIVWFYGNGQEKMRIWSSNAYTSTTGPSYRLYAKDGTSLYSGTLGVHNRDTAVLDSNNNAQSVTFAYSMAGLNYADYTWLAAWNGYQLRAVNKSQFAQASHTHAYLPLSGGTMTGALNFANSTWNKFGDDVQLADAGLAGSLCMQGLNGVTGIRFYLKGNTGSYSNIRYDGWLRLNDLQAGSSGIYCGTSLVRTDGTLRAGTGSGSWTDITAGHVSARVDSGEAWVMATNGTNRLYMTSNSSGNRGIYGVRADGTGHWMFVFGNNSSTGTFYGTATGNAAASHTHSYLPLSGGTVTGHITTKDYNNYSAYPINSNADAGKRVSHCGCNAAGTVFSVECMWGSTTAFSVKNLTIASSDIRIKQNIKDSDVSALLLVNSIKIRQFDWDKDYYHGDNAHCAIGFIADELEELDPALAVGGGYEEDGTMNIKAVDNFYLMGYAIKAIQELSQEVDNLKSEIQKLKSDKGHISL